MWGLGRTEIIDGDYTTIPSILCTADSPNRRRSIPGKDGGWSRRPSSRRGSAAARSGPTRRRRHPCRGNARRRSADGHRSGLPRRAAPVPESGRAAVRSLPNGLTDALRERMRTGDHRAVFDCIRRDRMKKWWPMIASVTASPRCLGERKNVFPRKRQYGTRYLAMIPCRTNERNRAT